MLISEGSPLFWSSKQASRRPSHGAGFLGTHVDSILQFIAANRLTLAAGCAAGVGMCFFFCGVQLFARINSSNAISKVSVGTAAPGLATIAGKTTGTRTLAGPISGKPCYVYQTSVWQQDSSGKKEWKNVAEETGHVTFLIEDETGQLLVEPSGAQLDLRQSLSEEYGSASSPSPGTSDPTSNKEILPGAVSNFLARNGITLDRPTRFKEYCLEPETGIVITGTVAVSSSNPPPAIAKTTVSPQPEIIRLATGPTPQSTSHMSQQAKIAAALAKAGLATPDMWATGEGGLQAINSLIDSHSRPEQSPPDLKPGASATPALALTTTTMTMAKNPDNPTFIISNRNQPSGPTSLGWKSVALVLAGSTLTTLSLYVLLVAHLH